MGNAMKKAVLIFCIFILALELSAYETGTFNRTYTDPARNRQIPTTIYYPIDSANPLTSYPFVVFGHGFNGNCTSYGYLTQQMINLGWIIVYPRTEEVFSFNVTDLAKDMAFLHDAFYAENWSFTSPFYGIIDTLSIIAGYSMGGACAVAAAVQEPEYHSLVTMAAATYLYSSITSMAPSITIPSVTFSGSADVVAPPSNQQSIYNNLASDYKSFVSLTGVGHTGFYNNAIIYTVLEPWLMYLKTDSVYYIDQFEALLASYPASTLTYQISDNLIVILDAPQNTAINVADGSLTVSWDSILEAHSYKVYASENPYSGFADVSAQGSFTTGDRVVWTSPNLTSVKRFFYIRAIRE